MSARRAAVAVAIATCLAACAPEREPAPASSSAALTDPDHPGEDAPAPAASPDVAPAPPPAAKGHGAGAPIDFDGVAGVAFGSAPDPLREAWPGGVAPDAAAAPGDCQFLYAQPKPPESYGVAFMVEDGRLVRVDVDAPDVLAPGGGHAGMTLDELRATYAGRFQEQPHKYEEGGKVLVVAAPGGSAGRLVFEVDAAGRVTQWRIGLPPQVDYIEGCA